ncbi:MAG TPA: TetR family transcriptional regulator, partial [Pseudonocardia sp.]
MSAIDQPRPRDPRARAAQTKRDRTRRALLDAADTAFASHGWANARMEDIAAAAGVSAATAYNHFPTKH